MYAYETLEKLGLTKNEISIYLYLLRVGEANPQAVISESALDRSTAYRALKGLLAKGLIFPIGNARGLKYYSDNGRNLRKLQEDFEKEVTQNRIALDTILNNIEKISAEKYKFNNIEIFEGQEGYESFMYERIKHPNIVIREIITDQSAKMFPRDYAKFINKYRNDRIKKRISIKLLKDKLAIDSPVNKKIQELKEVRRIPANLDTTNMAFATFDTRCGFYSTKSNQFWGIIINDSLITTFLNGMFDFIWESSEIIY